MRPVPGHHEEPASGRHFWTISGCLMSCPRMTLMAPLSKAFKNLPRTTLKCGPWVKYLDHPRQTGKSHPRRRQVSLQDTSHLAATPFYDVCGLMKATCLDTMLTICTLPNPNLDLTVHNLFLQTLPVSLIVQRIILMTSTPLMTGIGLHQHPHPTPAQPSDPWELILSTLRLRLNQTS